MITKFDSLFAGHVDMDNVGYGGTPVNDRRFPNEHLVTAYDKALAMAQLMDRQGYYTFWLAEHHFQPEGYECIPNLPMLITYLSTQTKTLRFGCAFNILPMWNPLRLAEDYAMADVLTKGRITFGIGRGYHSREVETFGAPLFDQAANRDLFEEQAEIIFKAFKEESFSHHGKYFDIPPAVPYRGYELKQITVVPRPLHPVETWQPIQSATQRGLDFMAKHGIKGIIGGGVAEGGATHKVIVAWRDALARVGRETELGTDLCIGVHFHFAETREKAIKEAAPYFEENTKMFAPLRLVRGITPEQEEIIADPKRAPHADLPRIESAVSGKGYFCGPPEEIIEGIKALEQRYPGMDRINVSHPVGTPQAMILEDMQAFAEEVMPALKSRVEAPVTAS